jgi:hypothetical protein
MYALPIRELEVLSTSTNVRQLTRNTLEIDLKMSDPYDRFTVLERKEN